VPVVHSCNPRFLVPTPVPTTTTKKSLKDIVLNKISLIQKVRYCVCIFLHLFDAQVMIKLICGNINKGIKNNIIGLVFQIKLLIFSLSPYL
jgi:hypothetical protein